MDEPERETSLLQLALSGDESALAALFDGPRERLRRMIGVKEHL